MSVLISGITGQDGSYLAELLSADGTRIAGTVAHGELLPPWTERLQHTGRLDLYACDISDPHEWRHLLRDIAPRRVYHLAAVSAPALCAADERTSHLVNVASAETLCEWIRRDSPETRALLVSSSAIFGNPSVSPQNEDTPKAPVDAYGRQKLEVYELARSCRQAGSFVACAIPYSHESPRRSENFVFQKVCSAAARISQGRQSQVVLGDLASARDWGYAPEYAEALGLMLLTEQPGEFVLATGETNTVGALVQAAFELVGLDPQQYLRTEMTMHREVDFSAAQGDAARAAAVFGWRARTRFSQLVQLMVAAALQPQAA